MNINIKLSRKCAVCKYWYDPTNSAIAPVNPKIGIWNIIDINKKSKCLKTNLNMCAGNLCTKFYQCKL